MSELSKRKPISEFKAPNLITVYGRQGSGKTSLASTLDGPILFIDISDKGLSSAKDNPDAEFISYNSTDDLAKYDKLIDELFQDKDFPNIIVDTFTQLLELEVRAVLEKSKRKAPTQQQWGEIGNNMKERAKRLKLLAETGKNVIVLCQERVDNAEQEYEDFELIPSVGPALTPSVATYLLSNSRAILHTLIAEKQVKRGDKVVTEKVYYTQLGATAVYSGKVQKPKSLRLPDRVDNLLLGNLLKIIDGHKGLKLH